jgi:hypothetical protein
MARRGQVAPTRKKVTLETIEEHLKEQDRETKRGQWVPFIPLGISVILAGLIPLFIKWVASPWAGVWAFISDGLVYVILILSGLAMIVYGAIKVVKVK